MSKNQQELQHKKQLVASTPNFRDFVDLLESMADSVSDIRTPLGKDVPDTVDVRKGISVFLREIIDDVKRIRNNGSRSESSGGPDFL